MKNLILAFLWCFISTGSNAYTGNEPEKPAKNNESFPDIEGVIIKTSNLRTQPYKLDGANIIGTLNAGDEIHITRMRRVDSTYWYYGRVNSSSEFGWVSAKVLSLLNGAYPFIGKKYINFREDGQMLTWNISINKFGIVVVVSCGEPASGVCGIEYKGKFTNPLIIDNGENGFLFQKDKIVKITNGQLSN